MSSVQMTIPSRAKSISTEPPADWHFREGTHDREIWRCVVEEDEYRLDGRTFLPLEVVVDVGAHIGTFSWWAWQHGARLIKACEAWADNFALCKRNLRSTGCFVDAKHEAVWGHGYGWRS